jgi:hypothetical protein
MYNSSTNNNNKGNIFTYSSLILSIIFFIYALGTLIVGPNDHVTWFNTLSIGFLGIIFGTIFLVTFRGNSDNKIKIFRKFVWLGITLVILFFLFVVFIYLVFIFG